MASYQPYYLDVARYARGNKTANLLNNQTKSLRNLLTVLGLSRSASLHENKQSLQRHEMNPVQQTERDKSRPYAYRIACFLEDFISVINRVHCVFIILDSSL